MLESPHRDASYGCSQCSHRSDWPFQLAHHVQRCHKYVYATDSFNTAATPERYPCTCCDFKSHYKLGLYEHCITIHDARNDKDVISSQFCEVFEFHPCYYCKFRGHSNLSLLKHHDSCTMEVKDPIEQVIISPCPSMMGNKTADYYQCPQCPCEFKTMTALKRHVSVKHSVAESKWLKCDKCSYRARYKGTFDRHAMTKHAGSDEVRWFTCVDCAFRTKHKATLKRHVLKHVAADKAEWFSCTECSYRTKQVRYLPGHAKLKHAAADQVHWLKCTECSFQTKYKSSIKSHQLMHRAAEDIEWYDCNQCSYRAKRKDTWQLHMKRHVSDDGDWYNCTECSYRAVRKFDLKKHMVQHAAAEDINWFNCSVCAYRSKHRGNLNSHMNRHAKLEKQAKQVPKPK